MYLFIGKDCCGVDDFVLIKWFDMYDLKFWFWVLEVLIELMFSFVDIFLIKFF